MPLHNIPDPEIQTQGRNYGKLNPYDEGSFYADLWNNNPYSTLYYEPSFWDNIGLSNKAKDANANYEQQYNEYVASIAEMYAKNKYDSPVEQMARERAAGLNPDLTGLSGSNSAGVEHQGTLPPGLNGTSPAQTSFQTMTSVLGFATSTLQQINQIQGLSLDNAQKSRNSFSDFLTLVEPSITNEYAKRFSGKEARSWDDVKSDVQDSFYDSSHNRKMAGRAFDYLLRSSDYTASENAYKKLVSNEQAMRDYVGGYVKLAFQEKMMGLQSNISRYKLDLQRNKYDTNYYSRLNPFESADSQNRLNKVKGWKEKMQLEFYRKLYNDWKGGSDLAGLLLIGETGSFAALGLGINNLNQGRPWKKGINWHDSVFQGVGKLTNLW